MKSPNWLDPILYPFKYKVLQVQGRKLHFIDEGAGDPIVFVHGTPTWSFVWRQQIKSLSRQYRCVAPDHIGFGLSEKPRDYAYTLEGHAANLEALISHLALKNITLVVHDFGGPVGLHYALKHPENVRRLVILNSWMWSLEDEPRIIKASKLMATGFGKFLYLQLGFSARILLPQGYFQRKHLTQDIHRHYLKPLSSPTKRLGSWRFAVALHAESTFFDSLWQQRDKLQGKEVLVLWGEQDKLLPIRLLERWLAAFPNAKAGRLKAGHFLQEEMGSEVTEQIRAFIVGTAAKV